MRERVAGHKTAALALAGFEASGEEMELAKFLTEVYWAISLHTLHKMLQVVMGWENTHLYLFRLTINEKTTVYGLPDPDWESAEMRVRDSRRTKLDESAAMDLSLF